MSDSVYIWVVIVGMTAVTLITRAFFLFGGSRVNLPERAQRALRYAPAAALAAVVVPDALTWHDRLSISLANHQMLAALAGLLWFLWRRNMVETIVVGMLIFTALRWWA
jgi:branched-subunit amino acid transport protein